jgi:hypothetical protein
MLGLPGTGIVYRHYQRRQKPIPVYAPPEITHPARIRTRSDISWDSLRAGLLVWDSAICDRLDYCVSCQSRTLER